MPSRSSLQPIPTAYGGYQFRSRLEARWAVFFTQMCFRFAYESEGWALPGGWYLPDFFLVFPRGGMWIEVKAHNGATDVARRKCAELAVGNRHPVYLIAGPPAFGEFRWERWGVDGKHTRLHGDAVAVPREWYDAMRLPVHEFPDECAASRAAMGWRFDSSAIDQLFRKAAS
jgi:hypothetical protein